jgi:CheY-like chemotaxis protein
LNDNNVILLVEDCSEDASLVLRAFKKWGITNPIRVIPDGEEAVDYLAGNGRYADREEYPLPCLALLDLNLPQMSGFDVLDWRQSQADLGNLPVVILSGTKNRDDFDKAHRMGAVACVVKSQDLTELYELIQHLNYVALAYDHKGSMEWFPEA